MARRTGRFRCGSVSTSAFVVNLGIGSFLFAKHLWVIMIIYLLIGVCQAPTWVNGNQLMLHLVPPTRFTEGMAWMGAMNSIGGSWVPRSPASSSTAWARMAASWW